MTIDFRPGKDNIVPDAISRLCGLVSMSDEAVVRATDRLVLGVGPRGGDRRSEKSCHFFSDRSCGTRHGRVRPGRATGLEVLHGRSLRPCKTSSPDEKLQRARAGHVPRDGDVRRQALVITVDEAECSQVALPTRRYGAIHRGGLLGHTCDVSGTPGHQFHDGSPTHGKTSRVACGVHSAGEQSVESMRAASAGRCVPSRLTIHSSRMQRDQPGEARRAPFSALPGAPPTMAAADGRVGALQAWADGRPRRPAAGCGRFSS